MKILLDHPLPFALAHGGVQTQIEQTKAALERAGVEVEFLRWWDDQQRGDLIHFFGAASNAYLLHARRIKLPVVMTQLFTETCNRSDARLVCQGLLVRMILTLPFGEGVKQQFAWRVYHNCTHNIVGLEAERRVLELVYGIPREQISIVPLGLPEIFLKAKPGDRSGDYLVCVGTITERKNCVLLAQLARKAQTPILFVGRPYSDHDPYWAEFDALVDGRWVRHQSHVADPAAMIALLQRARGAVIVSRYENWCLVAHEAAACGLPVLVQDQKWSRERFGDQACYLKSIGVTAQNVGILKQFYADAPNLPASAIKLYSWDDAAFELKKIYERVLSTSR